MNGKLVGGFLIAAAAIAGAALYYLQVFHFYEEVALAEDGGTVSITLETGAGPVPLAVRDFSGIDAESSPLRFRGCMTTAAPEALADARPFPGAVPLNAPYWFDCFDAAAIGAALADGTATAYLSQHDIRPGVDRVLAVYPDGRAFAWHQANATLED